MQSAASRKRADQLFRLHEQERPLVLVDAWDGGSARLLERASAAAIGVSARGVAWSLGCGAPEELLSADLVAACARVCRSVSVPVSLDLEGYWGTRADDPGDLLAALIEAGVSGVDLPERHIARLRGRPMSTDARFFINAQIDAGPDPAGHGRARYQDAVLRAQHYASAIADGIFVQGIHLGDVVRFARAVALPVTVDVGDGWAPPVHGLARAGVRRISLRSGPSSSAFDLFRRISTEALSRGCYDTMNRHLPSDGKQILFSVTASR